MNIFMVMEAVASVSLSHEEACRCTTCKAALGDQAAMAQIIADLEAREESELEPRLGVATLPKPRSEK